MSIPDTDAALTALGSRVQALVDGHCDEYHDDEDDPPCDCSSVVKDLVALARAVGARKVLEEIVGWDAETGLTRELSEIGLRATQELNKLWPDRKGG